ncbi:MAG: alanine--tRNA ligase [Deltaproteobacteria bacterium]|nr:alanine--tRNA ligase [Deltaproteobacteria bacterium]
MTGNEIRKKFLDYFCEHEHQEVASSSLVPANDPTLLFTNAGMNQFKDTFLGLEDRKYKRATTSQKCVRAGGKHNDLENVGRTARHHTFFEMLGNFSFGDYFKKEAITYAWDFLTRVMGLEAERLWATVYLDDDEAYNLWKDVIKIPQERLVRLGEKDNFWAMGDTGPCGPCSEILYDQGENMSCGPGCGIGSCDCDRYLEIWNLVFMQFNRDASGTMTPLPKPSIDTGMGLERLAAVVQGVQSNYDTDLLRRVIAAAEKISGKVYGDDPENDVSLRVLADHSRAATFLITDGILPANEGRGYVLRRIMRRAARHGKMLGLNDPFLYQLAAAVADVMQQAYPELKESLPFVSRVIRSEEERFGETLDRGLKVLDEELEKLKASGKSTLSGEATFKLYDTFGFPVDLTEDIIEKDGFTVDHTGFVEQMQKQQELSRKAWKGSGEEAIAEVYKNLLNEGLRSDFVGYENFAANAKVLYLLHDGSPVSRAEQGQEVEIIFDRTPFYGESGGQAGDHGRGQGAEGVSFTIMKTTKPLPGLILHKARILEGEIRLDDTFQLVVAREERLATARHHSATHLLQAKLQKVLGDHVKQAGSLVTSERLRFDFSHFSALTEAELEEIELLVNRDVMANLPVYTEETDMETAVRHGAMAIFGEKYGAQVRMVSMGDVSIELCGGTHVESTGDIGFVKIVSDTGIAAGVRRIEALAGVAAWKYINQHEKIIAEAAARLKGVPGELVERIERLQEVNRDQQKEIASLKEKLVTAAAGGSSGSGSKLEVINGIPVLVQKVDCDDPKEMRRIMDVYKQKNVDGITLLGAIHAGKAILIVHVGKDWQKKYPAGSLISELAAKVGGKGGGKPELAQAGGPDGYKLEDALAHLQTLLQA